MKKTTLTTALSSIVLAAALGSTACVDAPSSPRKTEVSEAIVTIVGVPMDVAQYTQSSYTTIDSYTFPIKVDGRRECASMIGGWPQDSQYDRMVISMAYNAQSSVAFDTVGSRTSNGCYTMTSRPKFLETK